MKFGSYLIRPSLNSLLAVLFPCSCVLCKKPVEDFGLGVVCQDCWSQVDALRAPLCAQCGYAFPSQVMQFAKPLCGVCRRGLFRFDFARSYSQFQDPVKEIIHQFKYRSHRSLARPLARLLSAIYQNSPNSLSASFVVPVPLHKSRRRERGFNQSEDLARCFANLTQISLRTHLLERVRPTQVQAGLSRRERRLNVAGAFRVSKGAEIRARTVLLVDDVFTTGATLNECARMLKGAGAKRVNVLTLARVIRE